MACVRFCKAGYQAIQAGVKAAPTVAKAARSGAVAARETVRNGNNFVRIGKGRVSLGPARNHWKRLGPVGQSLLRLHIHIERRYGGIDNWLRGTNTTWWKRG